MRSESLPEMRPDKQTARQVIRSQVRFLKEMLAHSQILAQARVPALISQARKDLAESLGNEIERRIQATGN